MIPRTFIYKPYHPYLAQLKALPGKGYKEVGWVFSNPTQTLLVIFIPTVMADLAWLQI